MLKVSYKKIGIILAATGGVAVLVFGLGNLNVSLAEDTCYVCCCGDGNIVPAADCAVSCGVDYKGVNHGGVQGQKAYACGSYTLPSYSECAALPSDPIEYQNGGMCYPPCGPTEECKQDSLLSYEYSCVPKEPGSDSDKLPVLDKYGCNVETEEPFQDPTGGTSCIPKGMGSDSDKLPVLDKYGCNVETEEPFQDPTGGTSCIPKGMGSDSKIKPDVSVNGFLRLSTLKQLFRGGPSSVALSPTGPKTIKDIVIKALDFLITLAIPFAILAIIWAGFMFVTAQGNEQKIGKARQNLLWTVVGVAIILASKVLIGYIQDLIVGGGTSAASFFDRIRGTLNLVIELLFVLATVYFFWGVINYIGAAGDESKLRDGKRHMIWGIVGMVIMAGAWGLVTILANYIQ